MTSYGSVNLEDFIRKAEESIVGRLLTLVRWSHSGGDYDHVLFDNRADFEIFVRALPKKTNVLAFPRLAPDALFIPTTVEDVRRVISEANLPEDEAYLMVPVKGKDYRTIHTHWSGLSFPVGHNPIYLATEYDDDPSVMGEEELLGKTVAFYRREPTWTSGHDYFEVLIGILPGAY